MTEGEFDDLEGITFKNLQKESNPKFYEWVKQILQFNLVRSVRINTYLLNFSIGNTFFPWFKTLNKEIPTLMPDNLDSSILNGFMISSDRIYGLNIFLPMKYKFTSELSEEETDKKIDKLWSYGPLVNKFFINNTIKSNLQKIDLKTIFTALKRFSIKNTLIPDLSFDPEYKKVINSEALKQVYDTGFITDFLNSKLPEEPKYIPERNLLLRQLQSSRDRRKKLFRIDHDLTISKFMLEYLNHFPVSFIGSHEQIDEIIKVFTEYYSNRIPSKKRKITEFIFCFGELLKFTEGKLYCEFRYVKIVKKLKKYINNLIVIKFLENFCLKKENKEFPQTYEEFKPSDFLNKYNHFLSYALYNISGFVYTGVFVVWRSLIKYLERLQKTRVFQDKKASLLENWCYHKAVGKGFKPMKIILINHKRESTPTYDKMKKQIRDFPKIAVKEKESTFPEGFNGFYREIDLVFCVERYLFMFECKGTRVPKGEQEEYINWIDNFFVNIQGLANKGELLFYNLKNELVSISGLEDVELFIPFQIQTEGIMSSTGCITIEGYLKLLEDIRIHVDNGTFNDFIEKNLVKR
ncbi:hypothetical protein LCGC14_0586020 [marine sediment metagenome]|uniref:Uncharacterized protein n=1 Tax=marine sediment metagenome TaxID=412755 RepID=A0A0F9U149_9ZZZZ